MRGEAAHAGAAAVDRRREGGDRQLAGQDGQQGPEIPLLAGRPTSKAKRPTFVVQAAGQTSGLEVSRTVAAAKTLWPSQGDSPALARVAPIRARRCDVGADRALLEIQIERGLLVLDHPEILEQAGDRPVAVAGLLFRLQHGGVDLEAGAAGGRGEFLEQVEQPFRWRCGRGPASRRRSPRHWSAGSAAAAFRRRARSRGRRCRSARPRPWRAARRCRSLRPPRRR